MTVRIANGTAHLEGECGAGDAEPLFAALASGRITSVDISSCAGMHAALAQALSRFSIAIAGEPEDRFLREYLAPALTRARERAELDTNRALARSVK